jgi:hypothetical protein
MGGIMAVSSNHLDSLLNMSFAGTDFTGIATTSFQQAPGLAVSTVTLTTTGAPGPGTIQQETLNVVAFNDALNSIVLSVLSNGQSVGSITEFVIGYSPQGMLLSGLDSANSAATLGEQISSFDSLSGVLSSTPIPVETNITFSATGSFTPSPTPTPSPNPAPTPGFNVLDTATGQPVVATAQPYTGPVSGLQEQFISITPDSLNITTTTPNWFIHSGSGTDAINVSAGGGTNVLDGSTGSNFLTGGSGNDTFFLDDRSPAADVFSTVVGFHSGDNATVFGVNPSDFTVNKLDNQGAAGFTGLDFAFSAPGHANANIVLAGFSSADLANGRLTTTFGTTPDLPGLPGSQYLLIHAN